MDGLLLSIAMPSYNVERYLRRGLDSFDDPRLEGKVELLIIDDGSTDSTASIAMEYMQRNPQAFRRSPGNRPKDEFPQTHPSPTRPFRNERRQPSNG